ncbi:ParB/RepB/Spo0J family partition protein [Blautia stercoris]|jgi:ParB family chromosome partitioning protein|uniref:ParB/RepB/Spo0J family partition protein n=1 Tax=Blautia stercoris TaxID=871664 RepID=UPI00355BF3C4
MAVKRGGLGKGLDSMIPILDSTATKKKTGRTAIDKEALQNAAKEAHKHQKEKMEFEGKPGEQVQIVKLTKVEPSREQPRKQFDADALQELAESIKQFGVLQPLLVQKKEDYYEIIAGERRWRASKLAGLKEVPVIVKEFTEQEAVEISLIENIQREDLNPIEEAMAYKRLMEEFHLKQDAIAERVSKSRTAVTNSMRLLKLDDRVQQMLIDEMISTGHARALLALESKDAQAEAAVKVFDEKLSVRETERLVKELLNPVQKKEEKPKNQAEELVYKNLEEKIKQIIGSKVAINRKTDNKGKIEIEYYSQEELERIVELLETIG